MGSNDERERLHERLDKRQAHVNALFDKARRKIDSGKLDGGEDGRLWLEKFCVGEGVQLCCGDFPIGNSIGVDSDFRALAVDIWAHADRFMVDLPPLDYVVTNYLECIGEPLRLLEIWHRRLKPGGVMAIVCRDSDKYGMGTAGPLGNLNRVSCFNSSTILFYLRRAGFTDIAILAANQQLRVSARVKGA